MACVSLLFPAARVSAAPTPPITAAASLDSNSGAISELSARARVILHQILAQERSWGQIHAAEALIATGEGAVVRAYFVSNRAAADASDCRIGAWRVRANTAASLEERREWINRIEAVFREPTSPDRLDAIESLAKLGVVVSGPTRTMARNLAVEAPEGDAIFGLWALALAGEPGVLQRIADSLGSANGLTRQRAAYALRWLHPESPPILQALARAADAEPSDTEAFPYLLSAALALNADPKRISVWQAGLERVLATGPTWARYEACQSLTPRFSPADIARLTPLLDHSENDARIAGALSILQIFARAADQPRSGTSRK